MNINPGLDFEVAIEILGQSKNPLVMAIHNERSKEQPNEKLLAFLKQKKAAIDNLMDNLYPEDTELIRMILDKENQILRG